MPVARGNLLGPSSRLPVCAQATINQVSAAESRTTGGFHAARLKTAQCFVCVASTSRLVPAPPGSVTLLTVNSARVCAVTASRVCHKFATAAIGLLLTPNECSYSFPITGKKKTRINQKLIIIIIIIKKLRCHLAKPCVCFP